MALPDKDELARQLLRLAGDLQPGDTAAEDVPVSPSFWWKLVHLNPALWRGLIVAVAALAGTVGLVISDNLQSAIYGVIIAVVALVQALWTKGAVTANKKVVVYKPDPVQSPNELAAGPAVSTDLPKVLEKAAEPRVLPFPTP